MTGLHETLISKLREAGLRPTRQRVALGAILFANGDKHVSAESLHESVRSQDLKVSLATIYNTLQQFKDAGLLRQVVVEPGKSYFDTNTSDHHHFFDEKSETLIDISETDVEVLNLPKPPSGKQVSRVDIVVRLQDDTTP